MDLFVDDIVAMNVLQISAERIETSQHRCWLWGSVGAFSKKLFDEWWPVCVLAYRRRWSRRTDNVCLHGTMHSVAENDFGGLFLAVRPMFSKLKPGFNKSTYVSAWETIESKTLELSLKIRLNSFGDQTTFAGPNWMRTCDLKRSQYSRSHGFLRRQCKLTWMLWT